MRLPTNANAMLASLSPQDVAKLKAHIEVIIEAAMKRHMGTLLEQVVKATPPYAKANDPKSGGMPAGYVLGRENIKRDVQALFQSVKSVPFRQLLANRDWEAMAAYDLKFTNPQLEQALRDKNERTLDAAFFNKFSAAANMDLYLQDQKEMRDVHQRLRQKKRGGPWQFNRNQRFLVKDKQTVTDYVITVSQSIGKMIWGWYDVAKQIGHSALVSPFGQKKTGGTVEMKKGKEMSLTVGNPYGDYDKILSKNLDCQKVVNDASSAIEKEVNDEIAKLITSYLQGNPLPPIKKPSAGGGKGGKTP